MKHASTRALFEYWNRQRRSQPAPARSDIDPGDIRRVLGDTFLLSADFADDIRFRLAGTRVCALFSRELKGEAFKSLWSETSAKSVDDLLMAVIDENACVVAGAVGRTEDGSELELELLLLPLARTDRSRVRALGTLAPFAPPYWLAAMPVIELELTTLRHLDAGQLDTDGLSFSQANEGPRVRHGLLVYAGGREDDGKRHR